MIVVQCFFDERIGIAFPDHLWALADGPLNARTKTATGGYEIPVFHVEHAGRLYVFALLTTTELVAIRIAVEHLQTLKPPSLVVRLTDSCSALLQDRNWTKPDFLWRKLDSFAVL